MPGMFWMFYPCSPQSTQVGPDTINHLKSGIYNPVYISHLKCSQLSFAEKNGQFQKKLQEIRTQAPPPPNPMLKRSGQGTFRSHDINKYAQSLLEAHSQFCTWFLYMKTARNSCVTNEKRDTQERENLKPWLLSYRRTAGQSLREVGVNVALCVLGSYRNSRTHPPPIRCWQGALWGALIVGSFHSIIRQVGLKKHTDAFGYKKKCRFKCL